MNLTSRLEGLTKYYGVEILCGEGIARHLDEVALIPVDRVRVLGRDRPETVHALVGAAAIANDSRFTAFASAHQAMLDAYFEQRWEHAEALNDDNEQAAAVFGFTTLIMIYRDRIAALAKNPPASLGMECTPRPASSRSHR